MQRLPPLLACCYHTALNSAITILGLRRVKTVWCINLRLTICCRLDPLGGLPVKLEETSLACSCPMLLLLLGCAASTVWLLSVGVCGCWLELLCWPDIDDWRGGRLSKGLPMAEAVVKGDSGDSASEACWCCAGPGQQRSKWTKCRLYHESKHAA